VDVRIAGRQDLIAIGRLAHEVWWESYSGLVTSETINRVLDANYTPAVIAERLLKHYCFMAVEDGETVGFAEGIPEKDRVVLATLHCRQGGEVRVGRRLVERMHSLAPDLPMCTDIALGHLTAEAFFESIGFSPGEVIEEQIADETIVRRRWWLPGIAPVALPSHDHQTR
jgi:hypothetical protein